MSGRHVVLVLLATACQGSRSGTADGGLVADAVSLDASAQGDASMDCLNEVYACSLFQQQHPEEATQRDIDSRRQVAGYICQPGDGTAHWVETDDCGFDSTCEFEQGIPACIPCGELERKVSYRKIDDEVAEDCVGCRCSNWSIYNCYGAGQGGDDQPFVDVVWQVNAEAMRFFIGEDGEALYVNCGGNGQDCEPPIIEVVEADIVPGGLVELDIRVAVSDTDNYGGLHQWDVHGHIVHRCEP